MGTIRGWMAEWLGTDRGPLELTTSQASLRAVLIFVIGLAIMRVASRRFLGRATPFDVMLGFLLGSLLSRAISGTAGFVETVVASLVIVLMHRLLATIVWFSH